ncbi:alpha/beta hydrolase [Planotetraspora mira]|uniref:Esterase n=1 Tax=Planotetraspora mira TaxID=58121 RepID=A0A8J3TLT0_9ACTN|nr:alpha/beta hydrolase [Planotetraspora mira]GII28141.1 esterase [Planotetraspora mira]
MTPPIGYLTTVTLTAVCVVLGLRPVGRPWSLAYLSFRIGIVINELPFVVLYWLLASTALALGQGSIDILGGWPAAVVLALLAVVVRRGLRTGPVIDHALAEGLGSGWRAADVNRRRRLPLLRILFLPVAIRPRDVERRADISYGDAGRRNLLDVYRHRSHPSGGPLLIHLHGGGFNSGRKNSQSLPLIHRLARRGWVCISANYRLRPAAQFPDHLVDLKKVIAWAREHAHEYGADPSMIFVSGSSAGGHLASIAALTPNDPDFQPGFEHADTSVTAVVSLNGWYGNYYGQGPESSPMAYIRQDAPPFFIAHGDRDSIAPVDAARLFAGKLRGTSSAPVVYAELPGAQHAFDLFHSLRFEKVVDGVEAFAAWVLSHRR